MIYTQAELEGMSDLELNLMAASFFGILNPTITDGKLVGAIKRIGVININAIIDYCNNWSDCGALIDELYTARTVLSQGKSAHGEYVGYSCGDKSLLVDQPHKRAVTIVYILIKQGKQNDN